MSSAKRIIPLFDRLLVQRIKPEQRTKSGLFIPENAQQQQNIAKVIAIGDSIKSDIKANDVVLLPNFGGNEVKHQGNEYLLFNEKDILAKLQE